MVTKSENEVRKKYKIPRGNTYQMRSLDAIHISTSNSVLHELGKSLGSILLKKYGDIKLNNTLIRLLHEISNEVSEVYEGWGKDTTHFISEAQSKKFPDKIRDLVRLSDGHVFEFETTKSRSLRFLEDPEKDCISVVNLWEEKEIE